MSIQRLLRNALMAAASDELHYPDFMQGSEAIKLHVASRIPTSWNLSMKNHGTSSLTTTLPGTPEGTSYYCAISWVTDQCNQMPQEISATGFIVPQVRIDKSTLPQMKLVMRNTSTNDTATYNFKLKNPRISESGLKLEYYSLHDNLFLFDMILPLSQF